MKKIHKVDDFFEQASGDQGYDADGFVTVTPRKVKAAPSHAGGARSRYGGGSISAGSQFNGSYSKKPSKYSPLKRSQYRAGQIICAAHVEPDGIQRHDPKNANQSVTNDGTVVFQKERKFVVLRVFATHLTILPIYTFEGKGLETKGHKNHYISIREYDDKETAAPAESDHSVLWSDAEPHLKNDHSWNKMSNSAAVHFTSPREHKLSIPTNIMGRLTGASLINLKDAFNDAFNKDEYDEDVNPSPEPESTFNK